MSAWARIVAKADPDELRELSLALVEIQTEQSARDARRIRAAYSGDGPDEDNWIKTPYDAADLIDPEVKP